MRFPLPSCESLVRIGEGLVFGLESGEIFGVSSLSMCPPGTLSSSTLCAVRILLTDTNSMSFGIGSCRAVAKCEFWYGNHFQREGLDTY